MCAAIPGSASSCKAPQSLFAELRHVVAKVAARLAKRRDTLPAQIQRQTIKVWHVSDQKAVYKFLISVVFFLTYTVCMVGKESLRSGR